MDYKIILGYLAVIVGLVGYWPYFVGVIRGTVKPHAFSWLVWVVLTGVAFAAQVHEHAGAGAWATGFSALFCTVITVLAFSKGDRIFTKFDWWSLILATCALVLWLLTSEPLWSVILVTLTDALGFLPTYRKGFYRPYEESPSLFTIESFKFVIALFALESLTVSTWLYPASVIVTNLGLVAILLVRRRQMDRVVTS